MDAEKLDAILELISRYENQNNNFNHWKIKRELFPDLNQDQVKQLLRTIMDLKPDLVRFFDSPLGATAIQSTGLIKEFLDNGGFCKMEDGLTHDSKRIQDKEDLNLEKTKVDLELARRTLEEFPRLKKRAKIAFFIAIALALLRLTEWIISLLSND